MFVYIRIYRLTYLLFRLQERLAYMLAGRANANAENRNSVKKSPKHRYVINSRANNNPIVVNNANGAY